MLRYGHLAIAVVPPGQAGLAPKIGTVGNEHANKSVVTYGHYIVGAHPSFQVPYRVNLGSPLCMACPELNRELSVASVTGAPGAMGEPVYLSIHA